MRWTLPLVVLQAAGYRGQGNVSQLLGVHVASLAITVHVVLIAPAALASWRLAGQHAVSKPAVPPPDLGSIVMHVSVNVGTASIRTALPHIDRAQCLFSGVRILAALSQRTIRALCHASVVAGCLLVDVPATVFPCPAHDDSDSPLEHSCWSRQSSQMDLAAPTRTPADGVGQPRLPSRLSRWSQRRVRDDRVVSIAACVLEGVNGMRCATFRMVIAGSRSFQSLVRAL